MTIPAVESGIVNPAAKRLCEEYIPNKFILGDGGLYLFIKLKDINARELLDRCIKREVIFTPGDIFYTNGEGLDTLRLGFSRLTLDEIEKGIKIIGEEAYSDNRVQRTIDS